MSKETSLSHVILITGAKCLLQMSAELAYFFSQTVYKSTKHFSLHNAKNHGEWNGINETLLRNLFITRYTSFI